MNQNYKPTFYEEFFSANIIVCSEILKIIIVSIFLFTKEIFHHNIMYEYINNTCVNKSMRLQTLFTIIFMVSLVLSCKFSKTEGHRNPLISTCPGEGPRYGDYKCIHDRTHRVCAKLVDNSDSCNELAWNSNGRSFWDITGQQRWNWKDRICNRPNPGDSWCICMWATANLIREVGCDNVHINCAATDVNYVLNSWYDGGWNLREAKSCLQSKCVRQRDGRYVNAPSS